MIQSPIDRDGRIGVTTLLLHSSGQFIRDSFTLGVKKQNDPQADGSSITYARRYALAAFVGVCPADDDAEKAMDRNKKKVEKPPAKHKGTKNQELKYSSILDQVVACDSIEATDQYLADNADTIQKQLGGSEYLDMLRGDIELHKKKIIANEVMG